MRGSFLDVTQRHPRVERGGDERVPQRTAALCAAVRCKFATGISALRLLRLRPWSFLLGAGVGAGQVDGLGPGSAGQDGRDRANDGHAGRHEQDGTEPIVESIR